jgi:hypothetical protein
MRIQLLPLTAPEKHVRLFCPVILIDFHYLFPPRLNSGRPFQRNKSLPVPEIIDLVFAKTSQNARFLLSENERFGLVFVKTGSINSGTVLFSSWLFLKIIKNF